MPIKLRKEQCCEVEGCNAPARDYGLCTPHYMGLTPFERKVLRDCEGPPTEELDIDELLRMLATMATFDGDRHFKDAA